MEQDVIVVGKGGDEDIHVAITVVIAHGDSHARHFLAVGAERHAGGDANLLKRAIVPVPVQVIWIRVVADEQIRPAIVVEILKYSLEAEVQALVRHPGLHSDIRERAVAIIAIERVGSAFVADGSAGVDLHPAVIAGLQFGIGGIEIEIAGNEQVQVAVAIVIAESRTGMPDIAAADMCLFRDVDEGAVAPVLVQNIATEIGDEQVGEAVIVVIRGDAAKTPATAGDAGLERHVRERAVTVIAIKMVGGSLGFFALQIRKSGTVDQIQVHPAVVVVVDPADARAVHLKHVVLVRSARDNDAADSGLSGNILEGHQVYRPCSGEQHRKHEQGATHESLRPELFDNLRLFRGQSRLPETRVNAGQLEAEGHIGRVFRQRRFEHLPGLFELLQSDQAAGLSQAGRQSLPRFAIVSQRLLIAAGFLQGVGETELGLALPGAQLQHLFECRSGLLVLSGLDELLRRGHMRLGNAGKLFFQLQGFLQRRLVVSSCVERLHEQ